MKILAIGDFHGKFPEKLKKIAKRKDINLIVSVGDFMPFHYRKLWFKHSYKSGTELWEVIGKEKYKRLVLKDLRVGERILKKVNEVGKESPVISVTGNLDYTKWDDAYDYKKSDWKWPYQDFFSRVIRKYKKINIFDYSFIKFKDIIFIGMATSTFPGRVKSKNYKKMRKRLDKLFRRFRNNKIIFVSHNVPYRTNLSKINSREAPKEFQGVEKGSKLVRRIIESYRPIMNLAGHMHENQGKCKIGKTIVVNAGAAVEGKAAIIEIDEKKGRVERIKFIR